VTHGNRLAAPNQFGASGAKVLPTPRRQFGRATVGRAVPAFHRQHAEAIANRARAVLHRLRQRCVRPGGNGFVERQVNVERVKVAAKIFDRAQLRHTFIPIHWFAPPVYHGINSVILRIMD
jgi:hypothetical protein